jgi:hypothetical protein
LITGRTPNSQRLNLQAAGVDVDQIGAIKVYFSFYASYLFSFLCGIFLHLEFTSRISFKTTHTNIVSGKLISHQGKFGIVYFKDYFDIFSV